MLEAAVAIAIIIVWVSAHWKRQSRRTHMRIVLRGRK